MRDSKKVKSIEMRASHVGKTTPLIHPRLPSCVTKKKQTSAFDTNPNTNTNTNTPPPHPATTSSIRFHKRRREKKHTHSRKETEDSFGL